MFRAVEHHLFDGKSSRKTNLEDNVKRLFFAFLRETGKDARNFRGVKMTEIPYVEQITKVNIQIYQVEKDNDDKLVGSLTRRSINCFDETVSLIQCGKHVCYVENINTVLSTFRCENCSKFFDRQNNLSRHLLTCSEKVKHVYPGGVYNSGETIFTQLASLGIHVPQNLQLFQDFAVFDFESYCEPNTPDKTKKLQGLGKLVLVSVSITSTLDDEPTFIYNSDPYQLVKNFCLHLGEIKDLSTSKQEMRLGRYYIQLSEILAACDEILSRHGAQSDKEEEDHNEIAQFSSGESDEDQSESDHGEIFSYDPNDSDYVQHSIDPADFSDFNQDDTTPSNGKNIYFEVFNYSFILSRFHSFRLVLKS